ncbi:MAG: EamA family transporter [Bacteroidetes bacterium]|jgi:uncharacterized membrane protein|nr:EamA family transporter [Bacteroidota bacterium]
MTVDRVAVLYILTTVILWGLWGFFGKLALIKGMRPMSVYMAEACFGLMLGIVVITIYSTFLEESGLHKNWNIYGVLSGFALALGLLTYYMALEGEQVHIVIPLTAIYPVVAVVFGVIFLQEVIHLKEIFAITLIISGTLILLY